MADYTNVKAAAIRGLRTALFTFFGVFIPALLGFITGVSDWAAASGDASLPDISTLGYAAVSAATAAITGFIGFAWNWIENTKGFALFGAKKDIQS
jgi:hypothetical protein